MRWRYKVDPVVPCEADSDGECQSPGLVPEANIMSRLPVLRQPLVSLNHLTQADCLADAVHDLVRDFSRALCAARKDVIDVRFVA